MRSLVISVCLRIIDLEKRTHAFEIRCYWGLLNISYKDHVTNKAVRRKIQAATGEQGELLMLVKKWKQRWLGNISWSSALAKTILSGTVKGTRTVRKSDYTPALALSKHMASVFDEKYRQKEKRVLNRLNPTLLQDAVNSVNSYKISIQRYTLFLLFFKPNTGSLSNIFDDNIRDKEETNI